jgi:hypothetical protein
VFAMLECDDGKFAGWKRGSPGSRSGPPGAFCCRCARMRCCDEDSIFGEPGCLNARKGDERPVGIGGVEIK